MDQKECVSAALSLCCQLHSDQQWLRQRPANAWKEAAWSLAAPDLTWAYAPIWRWFTVEVQFEVRPKCKTLICRSLRCGNAIKNTLTDVEQIKRKQLNVEISHPKRNTCLGQPKACLRSTEDQGLPQMHKGKKYSTICICITSMQSRTSSPSSHRLMSYWINSTVANFALSKFSMLCMYCRHSSCSFWPTADWHLVVSCEG